MLLNTKTEIAFTTGEIDGKKFIGASKEDASAIFTAWLNDNLDWITAGRESNAIEIIGIDYDLVSFNNVVYVSWLCDGCESNDCESDGEPHLEEIGNCRFEELELVSEYRR
jgi:hypothetical protein